jgi:hypothetical protein
MIAIMNHDIQEFEKKTSRQNMRQLSAVIMPWHSQFDIPSPYSPICFEIIYMKIPSPRDSLAGCVWLPRILTKGHLVLAGSLPPEYAARFCHPTGVDTQFLAHFALTREDILRLAALPESEAMAAFLSQTSPERIQQWNHIAVNLGRPGFPLAERFPVAMATAYKHVGAPEMTTIFELLEADEKPI